MRIFTEEHKRRISEARKGIVFSLETRQKMSNAHKGMKKPWVSKFFRGNTYEAIQGKERALLRKKQTSERTKGSKNYFYRDGISLDHKRDRERINRYNKKRWDTDVNFKLSILLRSRLNISIKKNIKTGSAVRDLGCTIQELKFYIEGKFADGMSWENWGVNGWHIDHIIPLTYFDLTDREQFLKACHYTNLQPLWAKENLRKGKYIATKII